MDVVISEHAQFEMARRQISEEIVKAVVQNPQQAMKSGRRRIVCQSKYYDPAEGSEMLLRVVYEKRDDKPFVVTVYRTSKVDKYWKESGYESGL